MGKPWAIVVILVGLSAVQAQDLPSPPPLEPGVEPSESAAALAAETVAKLNATRFRISDAEIPGFIASYRVKRDESPAGEIKLTWDRTTEILQSRFTGRQSPAWRKGVADVFRICIQDVLLGKYDAEGANAEDRNGTIVLDFAAPDPQARDETTRYLKKVRNDFMHVEELRWSRTGAFSSLALTLSPVEGGNCVTTYRRRAVGADGIPRWWLLDLRYGSRDGHPFPGSLDLTVGKAEKVVKLGLYLKSVEFRAPEARRTNTRTDEPVIPRNEAATRLGRETADRLNALHFSLLDTDAPGFKAGYLVNQAGFPVGKVMATWTRGAGLVTANSEGGFDGETRGIVEDLACYGIQTALLSKWRAAGLHAVRKEGSLLLESLAPGAVTDPSVRRAVFTFNEALLSLSTRLWYRDGQESEDRTTWETAGNTAYVAKHVQNFVPKNDEEVRLTWTFTYCHRDGRVFLKRMRIESERGDRRETFEFVLETVEFLSPVEEAAPDPEGEALAVDVLARAKEVHYALDRAGVRNFNAYFGLHWKGLAAGGIRFRWNLAESQFLVDHEGAVPFALSEEFEETNQVSFEEWVRVWASSWLWDAVQLLPRPDSNLTVRARRNEDETVVLFKAKRPEHPLRLRALVFNPEGLLATREERYAEGQCVLSEYRQEAVEGKYLRRTTNEAVKEPSGFTWNRIVNYTYRRTQGVLFPSLIEIRTEPAAAYMDVTETIMTLKELKIGK